MHLTHPSHWIENIGKNSANKKKFTCYLNFIDYKLLHVEVQSDNKQSNQSGAHVIRFNKNRKQTNVFNTFELF